MDRNTDIDLTDYRIENLERVFIDHSHKFERSQPEESRESDYFNLPRALSVIISEIILLKEGKSL